MYVAKASPKFDRMFTKLTKKNNILKTLIFDSIEILITDPFAAILRSHKVQTKNNGTRWSSRVTGDIRIIWDFDDNNIKIIELLDVGGHTGQNKAYK